MFHFVKLTFLFLTVGCFANALGFLDLEELSNIQYAIDILDKPLLQNEDSGKEGVILSSRYGQQYQCQYQSISSSNRQSMEEESNAKLDVVDLLKPLENGPCLVHGFGWWTYELCYKKNIRQYHMEDGKIVGDIISLGQYASEFNWNDINLKQRPEYAGRYHSQEYANGSVCDLTGELRSTTVKFKCQNGARDSIEGVEEPTTCTYVLTVHTNKTCQHPELRVLSQKSSVPITCRPLLNNEEYAHYVEFYAKDAAKKGSSETAAERETANILPGTTSKQKDSLFMMAEVTGDIEEDSDDMKRVLVGKIVRKLKNSLSSKKEKEDVENSAEQTQEPEIEHKQGQELAEEQRSENDPGKKETLQKEDGSVADSKKVEAQETSKPPQLSDASSELKDALEGVLSALNSEFKTLVKVEDGGDSEADDDDEEEEGELQAAAKTKEDAGSEPVSQVPLDEKSPDSSSVSSTQSQVAETKSSDDVAPDNLEDTEIEGSYITWQGQGNQIQQITIDTGMKVRVRQKKKDEEEEVREAKEDEEDSESKKSKSVTPPARKMEVRIINAAYYNADGKPVPMYSEDSNPSIERMVIAFLHRNDDEISEFEKQKRIEYNYRFKWSKTGNKKKAADDAIDD